MTFKSILKPEGSIVAGAATVGLVYGIYQLNIGSVSDTHVTPANHPVLETSRKKAGWTALVLVAALTLLTKDGNVGILGGGTIVAMELSYRHAIMSDSQGGGLINPNPSAAYEPAENVIPFYQQGEAA